MVVSTLLLSLVGEDDSAVLMSDEACIDDCRCCATEFVVSTLVNFFRDVGNRTLLDEEENAATSPQDRLLRRRSVAIIVVMVVFFGCCFLLFAFCSTYIHIAFAESCDVGLT